MKKILFVILLMFFVVPSKAGCEEPLFARLSEGYDHARVVRLIKTDIIQLDNHKKIHLIGVKAIGKPKRQRDVDVDEYGFVIEPPSDPTVSLDDRATEFVEETLLNKEVRIEFDTQATDENGYVWGYVFLPDGTMVNVEVLRQGYAELQIQPPNTKYAEKLREAYREARQEKRGLHAE